MTEASQPPDHPQPKLWDPVGCASFLQRAVREATRHAGIPTPASCPAVRYCSQPICSKTATTSVQSSNSSAARRPAPR